MNKGSEIFRTRVLMIGILIGALGIFLLVFTGTSQRSKKHPKVGYILTGKIDEIGWNQMNYEGIKAACEKYGCKLIIEENVLENTGDCRKAVSKLIDKGVSIIFLSSNNYANEVKDIIIKNKRIIFYSNYADFTAPNLTTYFVKMYQARYLAGMVAGCTTKTNNIGYIASMKTPEVCRGISAFAMGVKRINKDAVVKVKWTNAWDNKDEEYKALDYLIENESIDCFTYHVNEPNIVYYANTKGIKSIGYHLDLKDVENCLTSIVCDWKIVYGNILSTILSGRDSRKNYWWFGLEDGVLKLSDFSKDVTNDTMIKVETARSQILYGYNIFSGTINDNKGELHCEADEALSDKILLEDFYWLVEGVKEYE